MEPNIVCPSCNSRCVPRLWHYNPSFAGFRYMKTQHLCPFCGVAMYETGGQLRPFGKIALLFFILPIVISFSIGITTEFCGQRVSGIFGILGDLVLLYFFVVWFVKPVIARIKTVIKPLKKDMT